MPSPKTLPQLDLCVAVSRRQLLKNTAAAAAALGIASGGSFDRASAQAKMSQADAAYQDSPRRGQQCSGCVHFISGQNQCRIVEGEISPSGWCKLFTASS